MEAPGKGLLKVVSILFIIFGAISTVAVLFMSLVPILMGSAVSQLGGGEAAEIASGMLNAFAGVIIVALIIGIVASLLELILGIIGLKKCGDASQANYFIVTGIILCVLQLVSMILSFSAFSLIGFVLPVLYIVGGAMNKKAAPAAPAA